MCCRRGPKKTKKKTFFFQSKKPADPMCLELTIRCLYFMRDVLIIKPFLVVPAVAQWGGDLACLCGGTSSIPGPAQWVKDLALLWHRSQLQLRFSTWPRNFHMLWVWQKKKRTRSSRRGSAVTNLISIYEDAGSITGRTQWVKDLAFL